VEPKSCLMSSKNAEKVKELAEFKDWHLILAA